MYSMLAIPQVVLLVMTRCLLDVCTELGLGLGLVNMVLHVLHLAFPL